MNRLTSRAQRTDQVRLNDRPVGALLLSGPYALDVVAIALLLCCGAIAQQPQIPQGGASTGGVYAPIHDAEHRPITSGGFVKDGPVVFEDVSREAGLASWRYAGGWISTSSTA